MILCVRLGFRYPATCAIRAFRKLGFYIFMFDDSKHDLQSLQSTSNQSRLSRIHKMEKIWLILACTPVVLVNNLVSFCGGEFRVLAWIPYTYGGLVCTVRSRYMIVRFIWQDFSIIRTSQTSTAHLNNQSIILSTQFVNNQSIIYYQQSTYTSVCLLGYQKQSRRLTNGLNSHKNTLTPLLKQQYKKLWPIFSLH